MPIHALVYITITFQPQTFKLFKNPPSLVHGPDWNNTNRPSYIPGYLEGFYDV